MSGDKLFLDTNVAIYFLSGDDTLGSFFQGRTLFVSFVTELELLSYHRLNDEAEKQIYDFLFDCKLVELNTEIKRNTIQIRKQHRLKLPDSIIAASATYLGIPLITSDSDMEKITGLDVIAYRRTP